MLHCRYTQWQLRETLGGRRMGSLHYFFTIACESSTISKLKQNKKKPVKTIFKIIFHAYGEVQSPDPHAWGNRVPWSGRLVPDHVKHSLNRNRGKTISPRLQVEGTPRLPLPTGRRRREDHKDAPSLGRSS